MKGVLKYIKEQYLFFIIYFFFLAVLSFILVAYSREDTARLISSHWNDFGDVFFKYITYLGDFGFAIFVVIALLFYRYKYAIIAASGFAGTALITQLLKRVVFPEAKRPYMTLWTEYTYGGLHKVEGVEMLKSNSFPSGHSTSAFSVFLMIALVSKNKWVGLFSVVMAILTAFSRSYLGHHFLEDVFMGSLIGTFGMLLAYSLLNNVSFGKLEGRSILK